jgi:hypothetical protein
MNHIALCYNKPRNCTASTNNSTPIYIGIPSNKEWLPLESNYNEKDSCINISNLPLISKSISVTYIYI